MQTFTSLDSVRLAAEGRPKVVCLGMFDGMHKGHRALIEFTRNEAGRRQGLAVVFSFQNHPLSLLAPAYAPALLTPWPRKVRLFDQLGLDIAVVVPFDPTIKSMSPDAFVRDVLIDRCDAALAVCGYDFRFGREAAGTPRMLVDLMRGAGRDAAILPEIKIQDVTVSSTLVRDLISQHRVDEAPRYLGDYYRLEGRVVSGRGRGRTIGFPTANLDVDPQALVPPGGVYAVTVPHGGRTWPGMLNIGRRPTFETEGERSIEVHLIGFEGDLGGQMLEVAFLAYLRPERRFESPEALVAQLQRDRAQTLAVAARPSPHLTHTGR
ncbi:MAG: bifunctional riboflavin kinase/FAD synthetase [Candidatus Sumerlaeia bacterium]